MGLCYHDRDPVPVPSFCNACQEPRPRRSTVTHSFDVYEMGRVVQATLRIQSRTMVEPTIACDIVIDTDNIWRTTIRFEPFEAANVGTAFNKVSPKRMIFVYSTAQQVPTQPATLVVKVNGSGHLPSAECSSQVVGLNEF